MNDEQQQMQDWYKQWKQAQITKDDDARWRMEQRGFWAELLDLNRQGLRIAQEMQKQVKEAKETIAEPSDEQIASGSLIAGAAWHWSSYKQQPAPPATLYDLGAAGYWKSDNDAAWNPSAAVADSPTANDVDDSVRISRPVLAALIDCLDNARHRTDWSDVVRVRRSLLDYYSHDLPDNHPLPGSHP